MATEKFLSRHIGPREHDVKEMLKVIGVESVEDLLKETVPESIRLKERLNLPKALTACMQTASNFVQDLLNAGNVFQHGVADGSWELTTLKWQFLPVSQGQRAIDFPGFCFIERCHPGVDPIHDFPFQHRPGKMPISRADVKNWLYQ